MISRIQETIARSVPVTKALADECEQRQRCFRGFSRKKVLQAGSLELSNATNGDAGKQIAVDLSVPFLHAFVIPNYKGWFLRHCYILMGSIVWEIFLCPSCTPLSSLTRRSSHCHFVPMDLATMDPGILLVSVCGVMMYRSPCLC